MNLVNSILVVDDDDTQLKILEKILKRENYNVKLANSGLSAIALIKSGYIPDLMLLDITMPDMDGYHTYQEINKLFNIPTIFLTAVEDSAAELIGLKLGAIDYITKPFEFEILLARLKNHLDIINLYKHSEDKLAFQYDEQKLIAMEQLLTESEFRVAKLIAIGLTNQEIADKCSFSYAYVKKIAYRIFDKLQINKRNEIRSYFF